MRESIYDPVISRVEHQFTKALAQRYIALPALDGERNLNQRHVNVLKDDMEAGAFLTGHITTVVIERTEYRLNGQHQCMALIDATSTTSIKAVIEQYKVDTKREAATLYEKFDRPVTTRNWLHILRVFSAGDKQVAGWPIKVLNLCVNAAVYDLCDGKMGEIRSMPRNDRALSYEKRIRQCKVMAEILSAYSTTAKHMARTPVANAMMQTILTDPKFARDFWHHVKTGEMLANDDPAKVLREKLREANLHNSRYGPQSRRIVSHDEMYSWCIHAWNAARDGRGMAVLRYMRDAPVPLAR